MSPTARTAWTRIAGFLAAFTVCATGALALGPRNGPLGTHDYLIALELIALPDERSFIHIRYAYKQGFLARMATGAYFGMKWSTTTNSQ